MFKMIQKLKEKIQSKLSQKGQGMVEYAIIIAAVAVIAMIVLRGGDGASATDENLQGAVQNAFNTAATKITQAGTSSSTSGGNTQGQGGGN